MLNPEPLDHYLCRANFWFWKCNVPSKISIFVWRLLQIRLPTRDLLIRWGVLIANDYANCVLCSRESVNANYISFFFSCEFSYNVWRAINLWTGAVGPLHNRGVDHFLSFAYEI